MDLVASTIPVNIVTFICGAIIVVVVTFCYLSITEMCIFIQVTKSGILGISSYAYCTCSYLLKQLDLMVTPSLDALLSRIALQPALNVKSTALSLSIDSFLAFSRVTICNIDHYCKCI